MIPTEILKEITIGGGLQEADHAWTESGWEQAKPREDFVPCKTGDWNVVAAAASLPVFGTASLIQQRTWPLESGAARGWKNERLGADSGEGAEAHVSW